jgi:hypothetical protein
VTRPGALSFAIGVVAVTIAAIPAGGALSGCGSTTTGPLHSFAAHGQLFLTSGGGAVLPGQTEDGTVYVQDSAAGPVTLVSAEIEPAAGFPVPALTHAGVDTTLAVVGSGTNWPPDVPVGPFAGATLPRGESRITFGVSGPKAGIDYGVAGLKITYRYRGQDYTVVAWSAVMACVRTKATVNNRSGCGEAGPGRLWTTVKKMMG